MSPAARIAGKGIYDIPISEYVADPCVEPSLSPSVASVLATKTPAHARLKHPRFTPQPVREFDADANHGSAVHAGVFGGSDVVYCDFKDWRTDKSKDERASVLAAGNIPMLPKDERRLSQCVAAAKFALVTISEGRTLEFEQTIIWEEDGVMLRCRPDALSVDRTLRVDLKVTGTNILEVNKQFFSQGDDMQAVFMERGCNAVAPQSMGRGRTIYLYVENAEPFVTRALPISEATLMMARKSFLYARNLWRECMLTGHWHGGELMLPASDRPSWQEARMLEREMENPHLVEEKV